ncbi:hypothetical protein QYF61_024312 [Mycteria americana]|uniref:Uncharacterized protein n=1 Tax=Mycteria americana TaxID=33587 RepID=A0AAN7MJV0_MYCAM|nr:hypothetical protein QYF61_024312 [Mycteria americana]
MGLFLPRGRTLPFLLNLMRVLSAHFCSLSRSLWMAAQPSGISANPPSFVNDPRDTLLVTGLQLDFVPLITTLWAQPFSQFSVHLTVCSSSPYINSFSMRTLQEKKALLKSRAFSHGTLPSRSLKRPMSALLKSRVDPELHHLMVTAAKAAFDLHIPDEPLLVGEYEVQQTPSPRQLLYHLGQEVVVDAVQEPPGLLMPFCVDPPADVRVVEGPHEDKGLIIERFGLEGTFKDHLVQPTCHGQGHLSLDQVAQSLIQPDLEHFQGWGIHNFSGQPVPVSHHPHRKAFLPYVQSKSTLFQFKSVAPCPVTTGLVLKGRNKVSLEPSLLQAEQPQASLLQAEQVFLVLGTPELDAVLQGRENTTKGSWVEIRTGRSLSNYRITESQNRIGWKRPLRSSSPTVNLTLPKPPLHHVPKHLIQTSFKYLQGWRLNHFPGQPVPMLDNPFSEVKFPNIQSKPPLAQLEAISSCPITCYLGEETDPHLSTTSFQVVVESDEVSPQPPFLQAKQSQLPQPLLIRLLLQTLHQLRCPSLDTVQHLNVPLVVGGPKPNTVFEVRPHQRRVQGHDHFPSPAGHTISDTSQDAIGFLGHLGTLLAHIQPAVNQHPQVLFCRAAFQPLFPKPVALHGVAVAQVQDLALGLVKPHTIDLGPSIQPVQVPLQSLPPLKQINTPTQLGVICKLAEGALDPFVQIIDKDIKQNWPQHRALGNTACERPPTGVNSIHHHSLGLAMQPVLYPAKSTPVQAMSSQFLQENAVGDRVKGFTEVQIDNIHSLSLIH